MTKRTESKLCGNNSVLKKFVQQLACNNSTIRLRTIKKIKKRLSKLSTDISELELVHLWKGLHYAMWMTDKLLFQEALADEISNLLFSFKQSELRLRFFGAFLNLQIHEWLLIDQLRLDKFLMLVRMMFSKLFSSLNDDLWDGKSVGVLNAMLYKCFMREDSPNSFLFHILQLFLPELEKHQFTKEVLSSFIMLFAKAFTRTKNKYLALEIKKHILMNILYTESKFKIDQEKLSEFILKLVNKRPSRNQNIVFGYIKLLKNQAIQSAEPSHPSKSNPKSKKILSASMDDVIDDNKVEEAVDRWQKLDAKLKKKYLVTTKKRKRLIEDDNDDETDDDVIVNEEEADSEYDVSEVNDDSMKTSDVNVGVEKHEDLQIIDSNSLAKVNGFSNKRKKVKPINSFDETTPFSDTPKNLFVADTQCNVNATHASTLIVKDINISIRINKTNAIPGKKKTLKLKSPVLKKKKKYEISFTYDDESFQNDKTSVTPMKCKNLLKSKRVKFSAQNHSKEFHKNLTPKFDPDLLPMKSALKLPSRLNKTF